MEFPAPRDSALEGFVNALKGEELKGGRDRVEEDHLEDLGDREDF